VADGKNNRVMAFQLDGNDNIVTTSAAFVLGQSNFTSAVATSTQSGLDGGSAGILDLAYDQINDRLFVTDNVNNRVMVFDVPANATSGINGEPATFVLGQPDFTTNVATTTQSGLNVPEGSDYDPINDRFFVADTGNNRVMVFNVPANATSGINGEPATFVLGQPDFTTNVASTTQNGFGSPLAGVTYDPINGRLFVMNTSDSRVTAFNVPANATSGINGEPATFVLGQPDFTTNVATTTQTGLNWPDGNPSYDSTSDRLFIGDAGNNRVMVFTVPANATSGINGEPATFVLGQPDFNEDITGGNGTSTQSGFSYPAGVVYDSINSRLFVADSDNNRVLQFNFITITPSSLADGTENSAYSETLSAIGGAGSYAWSLLSGSLPTGLTLGTSTNSTTTISGTPTSSGASTFTIQVANGSTTASEGFTLTIGGGGSGGVAPSVSGGSSSYSLTIDNGVPTIATTSVTLSLYGTQAYTMELSNTPNFASSTWIPYQTSFPWMLNANIGTSTVYVQFRSVSGLIIGNANASIELASSSTVLGAGSEASTTTSSSLLAELKTLQATLASLRAQTTQSSKTTASSSVQVAFVRNLQLGMTGFDVKNLQTFLIAQASGPTAAKLKQHGTTLTFGILTYDALKEFQKKARIVPASGYFGPTTRAYVNAAEK
jgi:hypothetical protein